MQTQHLLRSRHLFAQPSWRTLFVVALFASLLSVYGCSTVTSHKTGTISAANTASSLATVTASSNVATAVPSSTSAPSAPSLQAMLIRHTFATIPAYSVSSAEDITCPEGYLAAGGGATNTMDLLTLVLLQDAPVSATTWRAQIDNGYGSQPITPEFDLECLRATGVTLTAQIVTRSLGTVAPGTPSPGVAAACPAGAIASGGGLVGSYPGAAISIMNNAPTPGNPGIWRTQAYNNGRGGALAFTMQIMCLSALQLHQQIVQQVLTSAGQDLYIEAVHRSSVVVATCPAGSVVSDGGLDSGYPALYEIISRPTSTTTWEEQVANNGQNNAIAQVNVSCLSIG